MTSRRTFLASLLTGIGTLTMLPFVAFNQSTQTTTATQYLTKAWNHYTKDNHRSVARGIQMYAGRELFEQFSSEIATINRRKGEPVWTPRNDPAALMFKACTLHQDGGGMQLRIECSGYETRRYYYSWSRRDLAFVS